VQSVKITKNGPRKIGINLVGWAVLSTDNDDDGLF